MAFDENAIYERMDSLEKAIKRNEHEIELLTNGVARYKERLEWLERMKVAYENCNPTTWEEWACKLYVERPDLSSVANQLNEMGYRLPSAMKAKPERKIVTNDISNLFKEESKSEIHECAVEFFNRKNKVYWGEKY